MKELSKNYCIKYLLLEAVWSFEQKCGKSTTKYFLSDKTAYCRTLSKVFSSCLQGRIALMLFIYLFGRWCA